jgi:hypothetical protein
MAWLEELNPGTAVEGIVPNAPATVVSTSWHGTSVIEVTCKEATGRVDHVFLYRDDEAAAAMLAVVQVWIKRLNIQGGHTVAAQAEDARRMCQILGVDFLALFTEARRAIPQPKSWAEPEEPDPPAMSAGSIDDDLQPEEEPSAADFGDGDVMTEESAYAEAV